MTVKQLIDKLNEVTDKSIQVFLPINEHTMDSLLVVDIRPVDEFGPACVILKTDDWFNVEDDDNDN